ncbi:MAG: UDP-glucose 4-epimerase GalE [Defluviitaleaceae bacterium]|nr:UDP-glucose 4-epimerase GalE [Defluviitaleaceae bacterium]
MKILVTGGAGYIGSTACTALIKAGHTPIILDSLVTGNKAFLKNRTHYIGDISDYSLVSKIIKEHDIKVCIHFAARIKVEESVSEPFLYYRENVSKSIALFEILKMNGVKNVVFSSSAAIYDAAEDFKVTEESKLAPSSPYSKTKMMMEIALEDFTDENFKAISLRYFNLIGACVDGFSGPFVDDPSHLLGRLILATRTDSEFNLFGTDWETRDGTTIRDYIHVQDLVTAHILALEKFEEITKEKNYEIINLGAGNGITTKEFVEAFIKINGPIKVKNAGRRAGDVVGAYTDCTKAEKILGFKPIYSIEQGIRDALNWEKIKERKN